MKDNSKVTDYINNSPVEQVELLNALRHLIHETILETKEDFKWGIPVFTKTKIFTYLRSSKNHVALGIYNIDRIKDPKRILEGTGKNMRHLKLKNLEELDKVLIAEWLRNTAD